MEPLPLVGVGTTRPDQSGEAPVVAGLDVAPGDPETIKSQAREWFIRHLPTFQRRLEALSAQTTPTYERTVSPTTGRVRFLKHTPDPVALQATLAGIQYALGKPDPKPQTTQVIVPIQIVMGGGRTVTVTPSPPPPIVVASSERSHDGGR